MGFTKIESPFEGAAESGEDYLYPFVFSASWRSPVMCSVP